MEKVTLTLALALCACGGNIQGLTSEDIFGLAPDPKAWLSGLVTNARTGETVFQATVQIEGDGTRSNSDGTYRLDNLPASDDATGSATADGFQLFTLALPLHAGANARDIALQPLMCGPYRCSSDQLCDDSNGDCIAAATLSGSVLSICDDAAVSARVTIDGKSTCSTSTSGKAYFQLEGLRPGGPQTFAVGKPGWKAFSTTLTLQAGFNTASTVRLTPIDGCNAPAQDTACTCTESYCQ
jgi:hypothetical protein